MYVGFHVVDNRIWFLVNYWSGFKLHQDLHFVCIPGLYLNSQLMLQLHVMSVVELKSLQVNILTKDNNTITLGKPL